MRKILAVTAIAAAAILCSGHGYAAEPDAYTQALEAERIAAQQRAQQPDQNRQEEKIAFINQKAETAVISPHLMQDPITPYELYAGSVINGVLISGMNSDLPGNVIAQVSQNVYDSKEGRYLLIPQGTKIIGKYDSKTTFGQTRGLVIWQRLIYPNGKSIVLNNLVGSDQAGYVGFKDVVKSHFGSVVATAIIGGLITGAVAKETDVSSNDSTYRSEAGAAAADNISSVTDRIVDKKLNVQPTIIIRPGYQFAMLLDQDILLEPYVEE